MSEASMAFASSNAPPGSVHRHNAVLRRYHTDAPLDVAEQHRRYSWGALIVTVNSEYLTKFGLCCITSVLLTPVLFNVRELLIHIDDEMQSTEMNYWRILIYIAVWHSIAAEKTIDARLWTNELTNRFRSSNAVGKGNMQFYYYHKTCWLPLLHIIILHISELQYDKIWKRYPQMPSFRWKCRWITRKNKYRNILQYIVTSVFHKELVHCWILFEIL